jgi:thiamine biosynthesis lipoprotein ApbE
MSERPTPETDTLEFALSALNFYDRYYKTLTLARSLERERDEARDALSGRTVSCSQCDQVATERDEARQLARELRDALKKHHKFANGYSDKPNSSFNRMQQTTGKLLTKAKEVLP